MRETRRLPGGSKCQRMISLERLAKSCEPFADRAAQNASNSVPMAANSLSTVRYSPDDLLGFRRRRRMSARKGREAAYPPIEERPPPTPGFRRTDFRKDCGLSTQNKTAP